MHIVIMLPQYSAEDGEMTTDNLSMSDSRTTEIGTTTAVILAIMATIILCLVVALVVVIVWLHYIKRSVRVCDIIIIGACICTITVYRKSGNFRC